MTLARAIIRDQAKALLIAANTDAGTSVFVGRNWPTTTDMFPLLLLWTPEDRKTGLGLNSRGAFNSNVTLVIKARVLGGNPTQIEQALDRITEQIEQALILPVQMLDTAGVEGITEVEMESQITANGAQQIGEAAIGFHIQYTERFQPVAVPLNEIFSTVTGAATGESVGVSFDIPDLQF